MTDLYQLPEQTVLGGKTYTLNTDFRQILKIFRCFQDESLPELLRWQVALRLFYRQPVERNHMQSAMAYLAEFIRCGMQETPAPSLFSWETDADAIIAGVNQAAHQEIRAVPHVHWWTFLSWFHAMPPGQLSTVVTIRDKLRRGKKLEPWEKDFYRENKARVDMKKPETDTDRQEKERLNRLLGR